MKKILSFTVLFIPWILSFLLLPFSNIKISFFLLYFIFISILFYFYINLFIFNKIKENYSSNFSLLILILYILNQSFNILVLYYNYFLLSLFFGIFSFIPLVLFIKFYED